MLLTLVLLACSGGADPVDTKPADTPIAVEPDGGIGDGAGPPPIQKVPPEAPPQGEPFREAALDEPTVQRDGLAFWGWSEDGSRFAFSTYRDSAGGASCDLSADYFLVDATDDSFVPDTRQTWKYRSPEEGPDGCEGPHPWEDHDAMRSKLLGAHQVDPGRLGTPIDIESDGAGGLRLALPQGDLALAFEVLGPGQLQPEVGAGYRAVLSRDGETVVIEDGERKRPWIFGYAPHAAFLSPDGAHLALVVLRTGQGYERMHETWMSNGVALPEAWR